MYTRIIYDHIYIYVFATSGPASGPELPAFLFRVSRFLRDDLRIAAMLLRCYCCCLCCLGLWIRQWLIVKWWSSNSWSSYDSTSLLHFPGVRRPPRAESPLRLATCDTPFYYIGQCVEIGNGGRLCAYPLPKMSVVGLILTRQGLFIRRILVSVWRVPWRLCVKGFQPCQPTSLPYTWFQHSRLLSRTPAPTFRG